MDQLYFVRVTLELPMRPGDGKDPDGKKMIEEIAKPAPSLRVGIDVLFPPFRTTIDDPSVPEKKTVIGQWYD